MVAKNFVKVKKKSDGESRAIGANLLLGIVFVLSSYKFMWQTDVDI
jgi:hypothetical protein